MTGLEDLSGIKQLKLKIELVSLIALVQSSSNFVCMLNTQGPDRLSGSSYYLQSEATETLWIGPLKSRIVDELLPSCTHVLTLMFP